MNTDPKCSPEMARLCERSAHCNVCNGENLYKPPKYIKLREKEAARRAAGIPRKKKEGMAFERKVVRQIDRTRRSASEHTSAHRRPNSGGIWHMPGDIVTPTELIECKERGTVNSRGEAQITIPKAHLDKVRKETLSTGRTIWYYVFRYKCSEETFVVKSFEDELNMSRELCELRSEVLRLTTSQEGDESGETD